MTAFVGGFKVTVRVSLDYEAPSRHLWCVDEDDDMPSFIAHLEAEAAAASGRMLLSFPEARSERRGVLVNDAPGNEALDQLAALLADETYRKAVASRDMAW
ncbi:hypothetical protein [Halomonas sp. PA16-9]|uniref:hypothetical protein n=1 Tax=Halomonas sp. PA16-9 TaxID=2576841 RepID=UPI0012DA9362|nr:hypothetical protein FDY98_25105 [Halomonas sp. PA16-9]